MQALEKVEKNVKEVLRLEFNLHHFSVSKLLIVTELSC